MLRTKLKIKHLRFLVLNAIEKQSIKFCNSLIIQGVNGLSVITPLSGLTTFKLSSVKVVKQFHSGTEAGFRNMKIMIGMAPLKDYTQKRLYQ
jgi:hypothetical protein